MAYKITLIKMEMSQIQLQINNFRAINTAEIDIDGITIVTGQNSSGKSTLSKLLYYLYDTISNYDIIINNDIINRLKGIEQLAEIFLSEIILKINRNDTLNLERINIRNILHILFNYESTFDERKRDTWLFLIHRLEFIYNDIKPNISNSRLIRLNYILNDILGNREDSINHNSNDINELFNKLKEYIEQVFDNAVLTINFRNSKVFVKELQIAFDEGRLPDKFLVKELGETIFSIQNENLSIPYSIQNTLYIDTPMIVGLDYSGKDYWDKLNEMIKRPPTPNQNNLASIIKNEILFGSASNEGSIFEDRLIFKDSVGSIYKLLDCATGIKAFSVLQLLLNNGSINSKTLLIIDEPESNLHPQWIVEYARIIVLIHKQLGTKFFLASHNPDFISAIKYISEKEGISSKVNFYLAEESTNKGQYDYKKLNQDIEQIYKSFNKSIDKINIYSL